MASSRSNSKRRDIDRDPGGFVALPWSVLDCPAYAGLSHPARSLLIEFARQLGAGNNGRLLASAAYLSKRGWKSADVITRAKRELLDANFIFETVKGHRPNKASWYAVTWCSLQKQSGYDMGSEKAFERGSYRNKPTHKNTCLIPSNGVESVLIAPFNGVESMVATTSHGAIPTTLATLSTPSHGNHLDKPSAYAI